MWQIKDSVSSQIHLTQPKYHIHQIILFQLLFTYFTYTRLLQGVLLVLRETFQDLQIAIFPFQHCLPT